jgi:hypothetical protein
MHSNHQDILQLSMAGGIAAALRVNQDYASIAVHGAAYA